MLGGSTDYEEDIAGVNLDMYYTDAEYYDDVSYE